jgi:hypothetical protein
VFCRTDIKKVIVLSLALPVLFAAMTASAAKCKFQTDTVNVFTDEKIRWTQWISFKFVIKPDHVFMNAISEGDRMYFGLRVHSRESQIERPTKDDLDNTLLIPAAAKLSILMADDSILELHTDNQVVGDSGFRLLDSGDYRITSEAVIKYSLNDYTLDILTTQRVKQLRLQTSKSDMEFDLSKRGTDKHQGPLACIR